MTEGRNPIFFDSFRAPIIMLYTYYVLSKSFWTEMNSWYQFLVKAHSAFPWWLFFRKQLSKATIYMYVFDEETLL